MAYAMISEVESFTTDSMIKAYYFWSSFMCCAVAVVKEAEKDLLSKHLAAAKMEEILLFEILVKRHRLNKLNHKV